MSLPVRAAALALLVSLVATAPFAAMAAPAQAQQSALTVEGTTMYISLQANGDANWTVVHRFDVTEDNRAAFADLVSEFEQGGTGTIGITAYRAMRQEASAVVDREMRITDVNRTGDVANGTLQLRFRWTNFARQEGDVYYVGDAFNTSDGMWLEGLTGEETLIIELPDGVGDVREVPRGIQNGQIRWEGPVEFDPSDLRIVYDRTTRTERPPDPTETGTGTPTATPGDTATPNGTATGTGTEPDEESDVVLWGGFLVLGLGIVVVGVYVLSRREGGLGGASTGEQADGSDGPAAAEPAEERSEAGGAAAADTVDEELLSDEERVERLLERNGGRMKQANIVKETGWSNAKVSQLLSSMAEEGRIDKLRIGRENLISFPDEDVTDLEE